MQKAPTDCLTGPGSLFFGKDKMKWFADDYKRDGIGKQMKIVRGSFHSCELFHIHTKVGWRPSLDLYETEKDFIMLVELAGMQAEDVEINLDREHVQIRGKRCRPSEYEVTRIHHMEIGFGSYDQVIALPKPVDPSSITSTYRDGFLLVRLPKEIKSVRSNASKRKIRGMRTQK
jgi:HSP20 family protein